MMFNGTRRRYQNKYLLSILCMYKNTILYKQLSQLFSRSCCERESISISIDNHYSQVFYKKVLNQIFSMEVRRIQMCIFKKKKKSIPLIIYQNREILIQMFIFYNQNEKVLFNHIRICMYEMVLSIELYLKNKLDYIFFTVTR